LPAAMPTCPALAGERYDVTPARRSGLLRSERAREHRPCRRRAPAVVGQTSFTGLVIVAGVAFAVPLLLALLPRLHLSAGAVELAVGIAIGPAGLGWVAPDAPIQILAALGLAYLLFLAGLEVDLAHLRGPLLRRAWLGFGASVILAVGVGYALQGAGLVGDGAIVAVILSASYLGAIATTLADAGELSSAFGRLTIAAAAIANLVAVSLLSLVFSGEAGGTGARVLLLLGLVAVAAAVTIGLRGLERSMRLSTALVRLQDSSAQIRVRGAFVLVAGAVALAATLGVESILAAFAAGVVLGLVDRDAMATHPQLRTKLEGAGYGFFIPVFMVTSGLRFDWNALTSSAAHLALAPIFLGALLVVRGLPALLYRPLVGARRSVAAGLLQATSLPFIVAASQIGVASGAIGEATAAALVAAGLLSLTIMPEAAKAVLAGRRAGALASGAPDGPGAGAGIG
jgi:Kef-type K+ transport system membrane component KefB